MSQALIEELRRLVRERNWTAVTAREQDILRTACPAAERARALYMLSHARWNLGRGPFDFANAIRHAREAAKLDDLQGKALHWLGSRLVTIGQFREGRAVLQRWISRFSEWPESVQAGLADVQYALGYAARYERDLAQAVLWYGAALESFRKGSDTVGLSNTCYALAKVLVRTGRHDEARQILAGMPASAGDGYQLAAMAEVLAAEGNITEALLAGEQASAALLDQVDSDPWELAELHLFLANLQYQVGDIADKDKHATLALDALSSSPRHDLYTAACLLLDTDRTEVKTG